MEQAQGQKHPRRFWPWLVAATIVLLFVVVALWPVTPAPLPPAGAFAFAVLGDAPYYGWEEIQYRRVLRQIDKSALAFVVHVGDILWRPCSDELLASRLDYFESLRHPVIYTPGDNEWTDCHERVAGLYAPIGRLARLRQLFFADSTHSLGQTRLPLVSQGGAGPFPELVENVRWQHDGVVFATVHLVGSRNGLAPFPGRTADDDAEVRQRTEAAAAWLRQAFAKARESAARAVVIASHADLLFELPLHDPERLALEPFIAALEEDAAAFPGRVLYAHGGSHVYVVDRPLVRRTTGKRLENLTRVQVPGSPDVGWVRVVVMPEAAVPFDFEVRLVPRWQFW